MHIYRWDLDKTYLDTDIHSVRGLIRSALESAGSKRNVPGSAALLRALVAHDPTAQVHILSGSPTQMRAVLAEKLALDGIRVDSLTLKDNLQNLRRGRLRAVRGQLGYKLPRLLQQRAGLGPSVGETLFGDDSEVDALVYAVYADVIAGRVGPDELARIMQAGGAYGDAVDAALAALDRIGQADAVADVFIHIDRGVPIAEFHCLGSKVKPVFSWLQAALLLWDRGRLDLHGCMDVVRTCTQAADISSWGLVGLLQDAVRRRLVPAGRIDELLDHEWMRSLSATAQKSLSRLRTSPAPLSGPPDYIRFLRTTQP